MRISLFLIAVLMLGSGCSNGDEDNVVETRTVKTAVSSVITPAAMITQSQELNHLVEEYYEDFLELNPLWATFNGDNRYDDRLGIYISPEYRKSSAELYRRYLENIRVIDESKLSEEDYLTYQVFKADLETSLEGLQYPTHLLPLNQMFLSMPNLFATIGSGSSIQPFNTVEDYENFLGRMRDFTVWADQAIANMEEGRRRGIVQPRVIMDRALPQLEAHLVASVEQSIFYTPILNMSDDFLDSERDRLAVAYVEAIETSVIPAYRKLRDYIRDVYLPDTRSTAGLFDLPDGLSWYGYLIRSQTTSDLSAEEIHRIGLEEVSRIRGEMESIKANVKFEGELEQFIAYMRSDTSLYYVKPEQLLDAYRSVKGRVDVGMPNLFLHIPDVELEIRPVEEFLQSSAAAASYVPGSLDGSRPGTFYVNTYDLASRPSFEVESIYLHEANPGHHLQMSLARQLSSLPRLRRFGNFTAYEEGWALYAESLGPELGVYRDPYQYFGAMGGEMLRAVRLVVDTGIHAKGWSREQALEYMRQNYPGGEADMGTEIERYMANPGQALSYKIGQLKIQQLRDRSEDALGEAVDIRDFHHEILKDGPMPLSVLEVKIDRWIARKQRQSDQAMH